MSYFAKVPFIVYQGSYFLYERFYLFESPAKLNAVETRKPSKS